ncbi:YqcI/YcgG family protein [Streptomyces sp. BHT-5-2]|uniref:YqcI/YcgG family protein n=1 Tax=Streptomyces sp. BHT-5-2 TaxID=2866715 RepID=UPI001C8E0B66|nr:YqcI/YcgG family protein [Streptomyces sp. BHT-5-2]QZL03107.1 YqcI/YcgG family protein [Streptomyces sp. BHT-5-2]
MTSLLSKPTESRSIPWEQDAVDRFTRRMLDQDNLFPCVFGVDAVRRETLRYTFVPRDSAVSSLAAAMTEFVTQAPSLGKRTSLVAFFQPEEEAGTYEGYRRRFWQILQDLHNVDTEPWPEGISTDTEDPEWEFCFAGMPMFVVANTPAHERRASRYFESLAITFQPRFVFDDLAEDSAQGKNARKIIRARLSDYDTLPPTPLLGSFGAPGNREWTQYFLDDDNASHAAEGRCPFTQSTKGME